MHSLFSCRKVSFRRHGLLLVKVYWKGWQVVYVVERSQLPDNR